MEGHLTTWDAFEEIATLCDFEKKNKIIFPKSSYNFSKETKILSLGEFIIFQSRSTAKLLQFDESHPLEETLSNVAFVNKHRTRSANIG